SHCNVLHVLSYTFFILLPPPLRSTLFPYTTLFRSEIYGFLGRNGAGKTTTIRMLLGLIRPTYGQIEIFGENLFKNQKRILRRIGSIVEAPGFYENLTAKENLLINAKII